MRVRHVRAKLMAFDRLFIHHGHFCLPLAAEALLNPSDISGLPPVSTDQATLVLFACRAMFADIS